MNDTAGIFWAGHCNKKHNLLLHQLIQNNKGDKTVYQWTGIMIFYSASYFVGRFLIEHNNSFITCKTAVNSFILADISALLISRDFLIKEYYHSG